MITHRYKENVVPLRWLVAFHGWYDTVVRYLPLIRFVAALYVPTVEIYIYTFHWQATPDMLYLINHVPFNTIRMNIIDLLIGLTLMNAMPHYILGVWQGKMLSGFGTGNKQNILWGLTNFLVSVSLFIYEYGINGFIENQIYTGALLVLVTFLCTSYFWYRFYNKN